MKNIYQSQVFKVHNQFSSGLATLIINYLAINDLDILIDLFIPVLKENTIYF